MAASVQVLCPNGRRQNVKVTPNTKLLQILEEVCHCQGFIPPEDFKLVQGRKEFDLSLSVRFSNIPNNAKLELARSSTARVEHDVTIALQLDSGERVQDTFQPGVSLWDLLLHFEDKNNDQRGRLIKNETMEEKQLHPVCIFMREEVIGEKALKATTLKKLGLTSGKAIIRLLHRPVEVDKMADICEQVDKERAKQAKLEEIAIKKKKMMDEEERQASLKDHMKKTFMTLKEEEVQQQHHQHQIQQNSQAIEVDKNDDDTLSSTSFSGEVSSKLRTPQTKASVPHSSQSPPQQNPIEELRRLNLPGVDIFTPDDFSDLSPAEQAIAQRLAQRFLPHLASTSSFDASTAGTRPSHTSRQHQHNHQEIENNAFLDFKFPEETKEMDFSLSENITLGNTEMRVDCDRSILVYKASENLASFHKQNLPDDFFEVTQADVKLMYRDLQNAVHQINDQPLMTKTMRQAQAEAAYDAYEHVVIRIHFPDKLVLQAFFRPRETVGALHFFVKECLEDKKLAFYLYTTPPKHILKDMNSSLALNHLAPAAFVYFGCSEERDHYLEHALLNSLTSRIVAETSFVKVLKTGDEQGRRSSQQNQDHREEAGPSGLSSSSFSFFPRADSSQPGPLSFPNTPGTSSSTTLSQSQVPKWFKPGKK